jgi:hypothetical protein
VAEAFRGASGTGSVVVYTVPRAYELQLELLTFTLTTDATAGIHQGARRVHGYGARGVTARLRD